MFESSSSSIIRSDRWPVGGMVDTTDLKSVPFGSAGSSPVPATKCKGLDFFCVYFFGIVAIKSQCVGLVRQTKKFLLVMEGLL